ncbi:phage portal protein, partial [bacterium]|nr:phage portal protein [bacterium]
WWDAMLARAVMESTMLGFSKSDQTDVREQALKIAEEARSIDGISANPANGLSTLTNTANMPTGSILQLDSKGDFQFADLKTPSNNFDKLQTAYIEIVGMAMDTPPEVLMSKYSTSFTAHKGALNDFVKFYMQKRSNFCRNINKPVIREIAKWLFLENLIEMPNPQFFTSPIIQEATLAGIWLGPVPGHINPLQEVNALVSAKDNAFITPADAASQYGSRDWDDQIEEWQQQMEEFQKMSPEKQAQAVQKDIEDKTVREVEPESQEENE